MYQFCVGLIHQGIHTKEFCGEQKHSLSLSNPGCPIWNDTMKLTFVQTIKSSSNSTFILIIVFLLSGPPNSQVKESSLFLLWLYGLYLKMRICYDVKYISQRNVLDVGGEKILPYFSWWRLLSWMSCDLLVKVQRIRKDNDGLGEYVILGK